MEELFDDLRRARAGNVTDQQDLRILEDAGVQLIGKPFTLRQLARKIHAGIHADAG